jgi:hypothetical protein
LQKDLLAKESSQKQLKDEVMSIVQDIMQANFLGDNKDCEFFSIILIIYWWGMDFSGYIRSIQAITETWVRVVGSDFFYLKEKL